MPIDITKLTLEEIALLKKQLATIRIVGVRSKPASNGRYKNTRYDMKSWDWNKTNKELIAEHGASIPTVSIGRKRYGHGKVTKWYPACKSWDWSKSNADISRETGCIVGLVNVYRKKLGKPPGPQTQRERKVAAPYKPIRIRPDYSKLDWTKRDIDLAREMDVSREYVRQMRLKLGHPKSGVHNKKYNEFLAAFHGCNEVSSAEYEQRFGRKVCSGTLDRYCQKAGIKRVRASCSDRKAMYPWKELNWDIPNLLLAEIWGINKHIVANHRCRHEGLIPVFRYFKKSYAPEYEEMVAREKLKAGAYKLKEHYDDFGTELIP